MRLRLNGVPPRVLRDVEEEENKALRLACVGETDYERALTTYRNGNGKPPLVAALGAKDEDAVEALLDGGDDPNEVDGDGRECTSHGCMERLPSPSLPQNSRHDPQCECR